MSEPLIRVRVSDLDQWVRYVEPERPEFEISDEEFLAYMERRGVRTEDMLAGSALHSWLATAEIGAEIGCLEGIEHDGFTFHFDGDYNLPMPIEREPDRIRELIIETPSGKVLLRGRIDARDALDTISDYKLSKTFDAERYGASYQWRAYLMMEKARRFRYHVFQAKRKKREVWIYAVNDIEFWRYPGMEEEVKGRVAELAEFIVRRVPSLVRDHALPDDDEDLFEQAELFNIEIGGEA